MQALLPNDRTFDPIDVAFNVAGSAAALALCNWYHKRMAERRRVRKYGAVPGDELRADDVELAGIGGVEGHGQELGVVEEEEEEDWDELDGGGGTRSGNAGTGNEAGVTV